LPSVEKVDAMSAAIDDDRAGFTRPDVLVERFEEPAPCLVPDPDDSDHEPGDAADRDECQAQSSASDEAALCRSTLPVAQALARYVHAHIGSGVPLDALHSAARVGLFHAARRYDPARGIAFAAFAAPHILGALLDELRSECVLQRPRTERPLEVWALCRACGGAARQEGFVDEESIAWMGAWRAISGVRALSSSLTASDLVNADGERADEGLERAERLSAVRSAMSGIHPRGRALIESVILEEHSLRTAGAAVGLSKSRASRVLADALAAVRKALKRADIGASFGGQPLRVRRSSSRPSRPSRRKGAR
jgi:RNA polymerase sigma factor FliA